MSHNLEFVIDTIYEDVLIRLLSTHSWKHVFIPLQEFRCCDSNAKDKTKELHSQVVSITLNIDYAPSGSSSYNASK